ncbi:MAG: hypothetical protein IPO66_07220 [Rhodanobacteraceae bacterium]|nr:hypothetical protein [Rhodanobacteraceae bacterium]
MNAGLSRLVAMICIAWSGTAAAATLTTVQDGVYWCTSPVGCAWGGSGIPGPADTGVIAHTTTLWGQGANPPATSPVSVGRLDIVSGGSMGIYEGYRLNFGGGVWSGGNIDACCNGGGTLANQGQLDITANPLLAYRSVIENNGTLRVAPGGRLYWNQGNGGGLIGNLTTTATPALVHLDDSGRISGLVTIVNDGIVRKTGAGTSVFNGTLRNFGTSAVYPGRIEVQDGTLAIADADGFDALLLSEGGTIDVASGGVLAIRDGGKMLLCPQAGPTQVYTTVGTGSGRVRLETGGQMQGDVRLPDTTTACVIDFAPGLFEFAGGVIGGNGYIRSNGEISIVGPDPKTITNALESAGSIRLLGTTVVIDGGGVRVLPGGTFDASDGSVIDGIGNVRLYIDGVLNKPAGPGTLTLSNFSLEGVGTVNVDGGRLLLDTYQYFFGTYHMLNGATLDVTGSSVYLSEDAAVTGVGTVDAATFEQRGRLEPGAPFGAIAVTGTLLQNGFNPPLPTTRISIGGPLPLTQYAQIQVAGDLRPFGVLRVNFRDGYSPYAGDSFDLITVGGILTDTLARYQVIIEGLAPEFQYALTLTPQNTVRLTALNHVPSLADLIHRDGFED